MEPEIRKNQICEAEITGYTSEGMGVARIDGRVVFIPGVIRGERWRVRIEKVGSSVIWARGVELLVPSPCRIPVDCPCCPRCGGCQFRHMSYEEELRAKRETVDAALQRIGGLDLKVSEMLGAEDICRYRNKVQFPVAPDRSGPRIGFYRSRSHDVIPVQDCMLQPPEAAGISAAVQSWMRRFHVPAYDEKSHSGLLRHLYLRFSADGILCCLVVNAPAERELPGEKQLTESLRSAAPALRGLVVNSCRERTNVILGPDCRTVWGQDFLEDSICGLTFRISVHSFFQVNHTQCERLYETAVRMADLDGTQTVLDLYCGTGTITLTMARHAAKAIGAEIVPQAVEDARASALRNGIQNAEFLCADAGDAAARLAEKGVHPDVICVDPPRKGLSSQVIEAAAGMAPERIVYISCNPATLARDLKLFAASGYPPRTAVAVDMFPRTANIETAVLMTREA